MVGKMTGRKWLNLIVFEIFFCYFAAFIVFELEVLSRENNEYVTTDAIVVLTGGANRLPAAVLLFNRNLAPKMFISGVGGGAEFKAMSGARLIDERKMHDMVLGREATNTKENAAEVKRWLARERIKSIRLVTSDYHLPRSLLEFKMAMPRLTIVPYSVPFDAESKGYALELRNLFLEYNKFLLAWIKSWV